jgi:Tfp pilus assembly protein PilV
MSLKRATPVADQGSMRMRLPSASDEAGYTLVELMVAAIVLVVGMMGAFMLLNGANKTTVTNNARMGATNLARELLEDARSVDYDKLTDAQMNGALQAKMGVTGNPNPWLVRRRGIEYTVTTDVCTFDDPKDNVATTPPADVCTPQAPVSASAGTLTPDQQPDDFRRVTVTMTWNTGAGQKTLQQISLVNNPSGGLGPRITTFTAPPDNVNQLASGSTATFPTVTTGAGAVRWNTDGSPNGAGDSTGGPTTWTTAWALGTAAAGQNPQSNVNWATTQYDATTVLDGTYTVTAQAFDDRGIAGDTRVAVLPLNRSLPITVTGFEAGRSPNQGGSGGSQVEFRWDANPERDIIGYRVYDTGPDNVLGNGNDSDVCGLVAAPATTCTASAPGGNKTYAVVAVDRTNIVDTSSAPRTSQFGKPMTLTTTTPGTPTLLTVLPDLSTGAPRLTWLNLDGNVRYYRIYRDSCCAVADRYDRTAGNVSTWVDPNPGTGSHTYWVAAVGPATGTDAGYNESDPSNGVSS